MPYEVDFSDYFITLFDNLTEPEQDLIYDFASYCRSNNGPKGFMGKVASTDNVPSDDPIRGQKIWFAKRYNLHHVHIGFPHWRDCRNPHATYRTSEWVVHFQKMSATKIRLVDYDFHDPMHMPKHHMFTKS